MTHHDDAHDFEQLSGRFHASVAPSPSFVASLNALVAQVPTRDVTMPGRTNRMFPVDAVSMHAGAEAVIEESWRAPRWMRTIEVAVASILVLSLVTASVYLREPETLYNIAFQPTSETPSPEVIVGDDAGRTWTLGDIEPETGGYRIDPNIPVADMQFAHVGYSRLLVSDSFVFLAGPDSLEGNLVRYDLERSEVVWTSSTIVGGQLASDEERIFAFRTDSLASRETNTLVAIDYETGAIVWEGPDLASERYKWSSLVLSNGAIFATDFLGNVVAVDSDDGSLLWRFPETFAAPAATGDPTEVPFGGELSSATPEIIANEKSVFVGLPNRTVIKLDRETGAEMGSIDVLDDYGDDIVHTTVQVRANRLVVTAIHAEQEDDENDVFGHFPTSVLVFDAESLELQSRTDLRDYRSNVVLIDDAAWVATAIEPDGIANVYRLDLTTGELGEPLPGAQSTRGMFLSVSGDVLMVTAYPTYIGFFDLDSGELINEFELDTPILETPFDQPVQMWGSNPVVITSLGDVYVIEDEVLPGS